MNYKQTIYTGLLLISSALIGSPVMGIVTTTDNPVPESPVCYQLHSHPDGGIRPPLYGMRLDELYDVTTGHDHFTFDFDGNGASMYMVESAGELRIFGHAFGGHDVGSTYTTDNDYVGQVKIDFTYNSGLRTCVNDDDLCIDTDNNSNAGSITPYFRSESTFHNSISLEDERGNHSYSFRLGDEDNDNGHRRFDGISGWGWLNHSGEDHVYSTDWLFTAEIIACDNVCFDDIDGDGYVDQACGGPDCDDNNADVHLGNFDGMQFGGYAAARVITHEQGLKKDQSPVDANRSDPQQALTHTDGGPLGSFYSMGFGGSLEVIFDCPVQNQAGFDLQINEVTYGDGDYPSEDVEVSAWDEINEEWVLIGNAVNNEANPVGFNYLDLGALSSVTRIRLVDMSDSTPHNANADGFDVGGIFALHDCGTCDDVDNNCDGEVNEQAGDHDQDGASNCADNCPVVANELQSDRDEDGTGDACDICPDDGAKLAAGICGCGISDVDSDNDQVPDCIDDCDGDSAKTEGGTCGCGIADTDSDQDGIVDCIDNCPSVANQEQIDSNDDGFGDACTVAEEDSKEGFDGDDTESANNNGGNLGTVGGDGLKAFGCTLGQSADETPYMGWMIIMLTLSLAIFRKQGQE